MRLPPSSQPKLTVTSVLCHPAAFGAGERVALIVGRTVSSPRLGVIVADPPPFVPTMVSVCIPTGPRPKAAIDHAPLLIVATCPLTVTRVTGPAPPDKLTARGMPSCPGCRAP